MEFERLPKSIKPSKYTICLTPNFETFTFSGDISIDITTEAPGHEIKLNSTDLTIHNLTLQNDRHLITLQNWQINKKTEVLSIRTESELAADNYTLKIEYSGIISSTLRGFYRVPLQNEREYGAATYFTPSEARKCFPCWDEPSFKASFDISIIISPYFTTISNMPVKKTTKVSDCLNRYDFESSPIMSTYLLAVVIGEYDYLEGTTQGGVKIRAYTMKNTVEVEFALEVAIKSLDYYCDFFQVQFPLPKLDLVALSELEVGAMEHWGLITFRETLLCVDEENTSTAVKERVAVTIAHELAHQWFGNLVTMDWWTHIWLNEGYASFMQYLAVDALFPMFKVWETFMTSTFQSALELDSLGSSHPIEVNVGHPSEVNEIFDTISYKKGCSIIRMLYSFLHDKNFQKGMHEYMVQHQYKNTETNDLWESLEKASGTPVKTIMSAWTLQTGYPVIIVEAIESPLGLILTFRQERFYLQKDSSDNTLWPIPMSVKTQVHDKPCEFTFDKQKDNLLIEKVPKDAWVKLNYNAYGFYRVLYPQSMLDKLSIAVRRRTLDAPDRLNLIGDIFQLARAGYTRTTMALEFLKAYANEENASIWMTIINNLNHVRLMLRGTSSEAAFKNYVSNLLFGVYKQLGWVCRDDEEHSVKKLRPLILTQFVYNGDRNVLLVAKEMFDQHVSTGAKLHPDIRLPIYEAAVQAIPAALDVLYEKFNSTESIEEKYDIIIALANSKNWALLQKLLEFIMSNGVRVQDRLAFLQLVVASSQEGGQIVWEYFKENLEEFKRTYENTFMIQNFILSFKKCFTRLEQAEEFEAFFKENPISGTERALSQSLELMRVSARWYQRDYNDIETYFMKKL